MFPFPDIGFGAGDATKVFVRRNGDDGPLRQVLLPPNSRIQDLLEKAGKALDLDARRAFYPNGLECTDIAHIEEDEVVYMSAGESFVETRQHREMVGNYLLSGCLGQGGFGAVMRGVHAETGETAAVKFVPKGSFKQFSDLQRVFQEIESLRDLRHPNIVRILDVFEHPDSICFVMEYCAGGELRQHVERRGQLGEEESRRLFKQLVLAVHYIHSKRIVHRDLKLENILLDQALNCKIVDFGLSDYVGADKVVTDAGTEAYLAPEVFSGTSRHSDPYKIDVWALGVILFALLHGRLPFARPCPETCRLLRRGDLPVPLAEELSHVRRLILRSLAPEPEHRLSVHEISIDPWLTHHRFMVEADGEAEEDEETGEAEREAGLGEAGLGEAVQEAEPEPCRETGSEPPAEAEGQREAPRRMLPRVVGPLNRTPRDRSGLHRLRDAGLRMAKGDPATLSGRQRRSK